MTQPQPSRVVKVLAPLCLMLMACSTPPTTGPFADLPAPLTDSASPLVDAQAADLTPDAGPADVGGEGVDAAPLDAQARDKLVVDAPVPPTNGSCDNATEIIVDGAATTYVLRGDTSYAVDEFSQLSCLAQKADGTALGFRGPQTYYLVTLPAGSWELKLAAEGWTGLFYAAPWPADAICGAEQLDQACAHLWTTDRMVIGVDESKRRWLIAVDSIASTQRGAFRLFFTKRNAAGHSSCQAPAALTLTQGSASVDGSTTGAIDEFSGVSCGQAEPAAFRGGQLYYRVTLEPKKTYKLSVEAGQDLALYAFSADTNCDKSAIDAACSAHFSDEAGRGHEALLLETGEQTETFIVVVDSHAASSFGAFTLRVAEFVEATNSSCAQATPIALDMLPQLIAGDTTGVDDEFSSLSCGLGAGPLAAGQLYYALDLEGGKTYRLTLRDLRFDAALYAFPASVGCDQSAIDSACADHTGDGQPLATDDFFGSEAMLPETLYLTPAADGPWIVAVDSLGADESGTFELQVDAYSVPDNGACAGAESLDISGDSGLRRLVGDTSAPGLVDEFPTIQCGGELADPMAGPQLYYRLSLSAGSSYDVTLIPRGWDGALYAFPAATSCEEATIDSACATDDGVVLSSDKLGPNVQERLVITPLVSEDWIVAVDSFSSSSTLGSAAGYFILDLEWRPIPSP